MVNGPIRIEDNSADQSPSISLANKHKDCKSGDQSTARVLVKGPIRIEDNSADQSPSITLANKHKDCKSADQSTARVLVNGPIRIVDNQNPYCFQLTDLIYIFIPLTKKCGISSDP